MLGSSPMRQDRSPHRHALSSADLSMAGLPNHLLAAAAKDA
jgi:hypothetical protein